jgi:hypothetical protein
MGIWRNQWNYTGLGSTIYLHWKTRPEKTIDKIYIYI